MEACDEDDAAEMIGQVEARLTVAGYERYEISSYARPGRRARHNARYWQRAPVLGLGMGAVFIILVLLIGLISIVSKQFKVKLQ